MGLDRPLSVRIDTVAYVDDGSDRESVSFDQRPINNDERDRDRGATGIHSV